MSIETAHKAGDTVHAKWHDGYYYPATYVRRNHASGVHVIKWHDGSGEARVKRLKGTKPPVARSFQKVREFDEIHKHLPNLTHEDIQNVRDWTGFQRGKFAGDHGHFWHNVAKRLPKINQATSETHAHRGFKLALKDVKNVAAGKGKTPKKSVESWTTSERTANHYGGSSDVSHKPVGLVVKKPTKELKQVAHVTKDLLEKLNPSSKNSRNESIVNDQHELIVKGGYHINPSDIKHLNVHPKHMAAVAHSLGIEQGVSRKQKIKNWKLHFKAGKPHSWEAEQ